jgi:hypothetical protein
MGILGTNPRVEAVGAFGAEVAAVDPRDVMLRIVHRIVCKLEVEIISCALT